MLGFDSEDQREHERTTSELCNFFFMSPLSKDFDLLLPEISDSSMYFGLNRSESSLDFSRFLIAYSCNSLKSSTSQFSLPK